MMRFLLAPQFRNQTIHFIGIGGIGMSAIAIVMHELGYNIRGSDRNKNSNTDRLQSLGINILHGQRAENIIGVDLVVISSAVGPDNPEYAAAALANIPIVSRAEILAAIMQSKVNIAVAGTHGKTTTTSLIACMLEACNIYPSVINGGIITNKSTNAYVGNSDYCIVEADESDGTFTKLPSSIGVITNIDSEHLEFYRSFDNVLIAFNQFIARLPFYGFAVMCIDHPIVKDLATNITNTKVITYGIESKDAHVRAVNIRIKAEQSIYDVEVNLPHQRMKITNVILPVPGVHNVLNSLAAISIAIELNCASNISEGFRSFKGVARRFTITGEYNKVTIIDDYAHHPTEIAATIKTAQSIVREHKGKVIVVLQPHRYSRLKHLYQEFVQCLQLADQLYISSIYAAGEQQTYNLSHTDLVEAIKKCNPYMNVAPLDNLDNLAPIIKTVAKPHDIVLMMGAGDITQYAAKLPQQLQNLL